VEKASTFVSRAYRLFNHWGVFALLMFSLGFNVYLNRQRHTAKKRPALLRIGTTIPALDAEDLAGSRTIIRWSTDSRPSVVYVFTPSCVWCRRNLDSIKLLSTAKSASYRFMGISLSDVGLNAYLKDATLTFPVYTGLAPDTLRQLQLVVTPETLMIARDGTLQKLWAGAYGGAVHQQIEDTFGVHLPALPSTGSTVVPN
jgi:hypothetical protein